MSIFVSGENGTLKSTNIPAAFVELALLKQKEEQVASTADDEIANTTVDFSQTTKFVTIAATVNFVSSTDPTTGAIVLVATNDLPNVIFNPGTDGTLKSTIYSGALFQLSQILANAEQGLTPAVNNINLNHSDEDKQSTINATIPFTSMIDVTGKAVFTVTDYLG